MLQTEVVKRSEEDGKRGVDPHYPGEREAVIGTAQQNCWLRNHFPWPHERFPEGASLLSASPLLNAYQSCPARFGDGLLSGRDVAIIERFFTEEGNEEKADGCQHSEKPESPFPFRDVKDEGCEEGPEVWRKDNKSCPDIDLASAIHVRGQPISKAM